MMTAMTPDEEKVSSEEEPAQWVRSDNGDTIDSEIDDDNNNDGSDNYDNDNSAAAAFD
jgi:hypothetical protein